MTAVRGATPGPSADEQRRINGRTWAGVYVVILAASGLMGLVALGTTPRWLALPLTMLLAACVASAVRPVIGLYLIVFFAFLTDGSISGWYPFTVYLSNHQSILFVHDALVFSPLELLLVTTGIAWALRLVLDPTSPRFVRGRLLRPMLVFMAFLCAGFVFGNVTGGNRYVAIWEFRPILYLPLIYLLLTNLLTTRRQYHRLVGAMLVAVFIHSLLGLQRLLGMSAAERDAMESLVDHGSAAFMSVVLLVAIAAWLLPRTPTAVRWAMTVVAVPVAWVWIASQRRAAVIALAAAIILLAILLSKLNRRRLMTLGPIVLVAVVCYVGAFWSSQSSIGFPAQALKTVVAPGEISDRDANSDLYRKVENIDISATIRARPITGMGFGQKFLRPLPLPDISFFQFYEYMPHNSVLWIWTKAGIGGFVAMLFLFGSALRRGVRTVLRAGTPLDRLIAVGAAAQIVCYLVFAYVDIAWDVRSMVATALAMAICSELLRLPANEPGPGMRAAGSVDAVGAPVSSEGLVSC